MKLELELERMDHAANKAWSKLDFDQAEAIHQKRHKLVPQDPRPLLDLGSLCGRRCDYVKAVEYFEKAIRVSGWKTAAFTAAGLHCLNFSQPKLARGYFDRALKKHPDAADILIPLAMIYERLGQLDEAWAAAEKASQITGGQHDAILVQAKVLRRRKRLAEGETLLRAWMGRPLPDEWAHAALHYELATNLDLQARYDEAMTEFLRAKEKLKPVVDKHLPPSERAAIQQQRVAEIAYMTRERFTQFKQGQSFLDKTQDIAFLLGHPRSGTTLLEQVLDAHPGVISAEETPIFVREGLREAVRTMLRTHPQPLLLEILAQLDQTALVRSRSAYLSRTQSFLGELLNGRLLIDKNPSLTAQIPAITRIFPEHKILVALRDPRDVCLSCFMQPLQLNVVTANYLSIPDTFMEYAGVMQQWLTFRDRLANPWLEVQYEDMVEDIGAVARSAVNFLGLPWDEKVLGFEAHIKSKLVRSPTYAAVSQPIYKTAQGRWRHYAKYLEPHLAHLEPFIQAFGYK